MPWQLYTAAYIRVLYASHDIGLHGHSVICRPTQATIPCLDMIDVSLSLSVVNSSRNLNVAKNWKLDGLSQWFNHQPVKLSVYQLTGTWQFRPFAHFILSCVFWHCSLGLTVIVIVNTVLLRVFAVRFGVALTHFDCIFVTRMHNKRWMNYPTHSN